MPVGVAGCNMAPLRAMSTYSEFLLEEKKLVDEEGEGYARRIVEAAERLDSLVTHLLDYGRMGRVGVQVEPTERLVREWGGFDSSRPEVATLSLQVADRIRVLAAVQPHDASVVATLWLCDVGVLAAV